MKHHQDDDLHRSIAAADPAATLPALRSDQLTRLTETAMNTTRTTSRTNRRGLILGGATGLAAIVAAAFAIPLLVGAPAASVTELRQPGAGGPAAMCATVTAEGLSGVDSAFRATATRIENGTVTLTVTHRYTGDVSETITVPQGTDSGVDGEPLTFTAGADYLIATNDGTVLTCGSSGIDSPELETIYEQAFN